MIIGFAKETVPGERRVALIPSAPAMIKQPGFEYICESNCGLASGHTDADYVAKGFRIVESLQVGFTRHHRTRHPNYIGAIVT
ncbi:MAG: hypothetical protein WBP42_01170 [Candidatus Zixiibacteriota bacterium]